MAATAPSWEQVELMLQQQLPSKSEKLVLTLYRDTNGWCPFCERVWVTLVEMGVQFDEQLINLRDKPDWYKQMVPTTLVPAIKVHETGEVIWESVDILNFLQKLQAESHVHPQGDAEAQRAATLKEEADALLKTGFAFSYGGRNSSAEELAVKREEFEGALDVMEGRLAEGGGAFLMGDRFTTADAIYVPFMERYLVQLPITSSFSLQSGRWPNIEQWFTSLDSLESYTNHVKGDAYSWTAVTGTFLRMFAQNTTTGQAEAQATMAQADSAAAALLQGSPSQATEIGAGARRLAARKLVKNRRAVVADATSSTLVSQTQLERVEAAEATTVEEVLRFAAALLLVEEGQEGLSAHSLVAGAGWGEAQAATAAEAAALVSARLCAPRDMGAAPAIALRAVLQEISKEATAVHA